MIKFSPPKLFYCQNPLFAPDKNDMMEMKLLFEKAVAESNAIKVRLSDDTSLRLYSLYKQATKGDIDIEGPRNPYDMVAKAEFDAWASLKGKSIKDAQSEFIVLMNKLKN
ncbi:MAG: acyl-CoA-binding protein [Segetibacter sp.]